MVNGRSVHMEDNHWNGKDELDVENDDNPMVFYNPIRSSSFRSIRREKNRLQTAFVTAWFSNLFFTSARNRNRCLTTSTTDLNFIRTWIALSTMTFTQTFMISTIQRFPTHILTGWTLTITTLEEAERWEYRSITSLKLNLSFTRMFPTWTHPGAFGFTEKFLTTWNRFFFGTTSTTFIDYLSTLEYRSIAMILVGHRIIIDTHGVTIPQMTSTQTTMKTTIQLSIASIPTRRHLFRTGQIFIFYTKQQWHIFVSCQETSLFVLLFPHGHARKPCRGQGPHSPLWQMRSHLWIWQFNHRWQG